MRQKRKTQAALLRLSNSRKCLLVPEVLVPLGWQTAILHQPTFMYKVVAAVQGRLLSIYDGTTEYNLGQTLHARRGGAAWAPLDACYFAYPSMQQASCAALPKGSQLLAAPRMLLAVRCHGRGYQHESNMWAMPHTTVVSVISQITGSPEVIIPPMYQVR